MGLNLLSATELCAACDDNADDLAAAAAAVDDDIAADGDKNVGVRAPKNVIGLCPFTSPLRFPPVQRPPKRPERPS